MLTDEEKLERKRAKNREYMRRKRAENPEKYNEQKRSAYRANPEKYLGYSRSWRAANLEQARAYGRENSRKWREANPELAREKNRRWYAANSEKARESVRRTTLKTKYGLTQEQWDALFAAQGFCCAICKATEPRGKRGWHTDHCHTNGHVRGILCLGCNSALGYMQDDPTRLRAAADFLDKVRSKLQH